MLKHTLLFHLIISQFYIVQSNLTHNSSSNSQSSNKKIIGLINEIQNECDKLILIPVDETVSLIFKMFNR